MTTATTLSVSNAHSEPMLDRLTVALLLAFVASLQISIAAANVLLAGVLLCWTATLVRDRARPTAPRFLLPLAVYAGVTLVSAWFSVDPRESLIDSKQLLLFLIV